MHRGAGWLLDGESGWSISAGGEHDRVPCNGVETGDETLESTKKADRLDEMETDVLRLIRIKVWMEGRGVVGGVMAWIWLGLWPVDGCIWIYQTDRGKGD